MKVGLIARAEDRGLGNMTHDWYRHMHPDRTLVVIPGAVPKHGLVSHLDWYPGATVMRFDGTLDEQHCREWLDGLDVVYSAETFYDWRFVGWARDLNVATVCHVMPEWWAPNWVDHEPSAWWAPTSYRRGFLPASTRLVPVPIATERFDSPTYMQDGTFCWLHIAGARTFDDRNGTLALFDAARLLNDGQKVIVHTQSPLPTPTSPKVEVRGPVDTADYALMYREAEAMVLPRRYAGLCLPALEAFGAGLPVVMTDLSPQNTDWPVATVAARAALGIRMLGGLIPTAEVDVHALAELMNRWAAGSPELAHMRDAVSRYRAANAWAVRAPQIRAELERVVDRVAA